MDVSAPTTEVGISELRDHLSGYIDRVRAGEELIVTDRGRPVARLSPIESTADRLRDLVDAGVVRPPATQQRHRRTSQIYAKDSVSDLIGQQRR